MPYLFRLDVYLGMQTTFLIFWVSFVIQEFLLTLKAILNFCLACFENISLSNMTKDDFDDIINQKHESTSKNYFMNTYQPAISEAVQTW